MFLSMNDDYNYNFYVREKSGGGWWLIFVRACACACTDELLNHYKDQPYDRDAHPTLHGKGERWKVDYSTIHSSYNVFVAVDD